MDIRTATREDIPAILALLNDDDVTRATGYGDVEPDGAVEAAFDAIEADPRNELVVMTDGDEVVGTLQLTFIPGLTRGGAERLLIEAVRIASPRRGEGLGGDLIRWAIERGRARGCGLVQLTSDTRRTDAHRFYERLGFVASHVGMKLPLT